METSLADILDPVTPAQFRAEYYAKSSMLISNHPGRFNELFGWRPLNIILNSSPIPHPTMQLVRRGKSAIAGNAGNIIKKCRDGATLILDRVDLYDSNVALLAASISTELGEPVRVNAYYSQPSQPGTDRHYDTHDVFILQISGYKHWQVFEPTMKLPLLEMIHHPPTPSEQPYLDCTLAPGDLLYIPRGHWHEATAQIEQSLHLTLGVYAQTGIDFLLWLVDELREDITWREAFPLVYRDERPELGGPSGPIVEHFQHLRKSLISKISGDEIIEHYHRFRIGNDELRQPFSFPFRTDQAAISECENAVYHRPPHQRAFLEKDTRTGVVNVTVWGKVLSFPGEAESVVRQIFSSASFAPRQLMAAAPRLPRNYVTALLQKLVDEGILTRAPR